MENSKCNCILSHLDWHLISFAIYNVLALLTWNRPSAKMGLSLINKELQFRVCNQGQPCASPQQKWREELFYRWETVVGKAIVNKESVVFHWLSCDCLSFSELLPGKNRDTFFFLLGSALIVGHETPTFCLPTLFNSGSIY